MTEEQDIEAETEIPTEAQEEETGLADEVEEVTTEEEPEGESEDGEFVVSFDGEEEPDESAPEWVRKVRSQNRELKRKLKELEEKTAVKEPEALPKPKLADFGYDDEAYEAAYDEWAEAERKNKAAKEAAEKEQQVIVERVKARFDDYHEAKTQLGARDFDEAEEVVAETLSKAHHEAIVYAAKSPEQLIYALGKNPKQLEKLAAINPQNPFGLIELTKAVSELESKMSVKPRKKPEPEKHVSASGAGGGSLAKQLERARAKAAETGDFTEVSRIRKLMAKQ